jgi:asparagine synthase (glutamine-hydrolysing)
VCGICGIAALDGVDRSALHAMSDALVHRGPDSAGEMLDGPIALAARRLAIIDIPGGDQPITGDDGRVTVVQNGEIYNHELLRRDLERAGHRFRTRSDTEVLLHLYEEHGMEFLEHLRGLFALALWDRDEERLVLARDAFGIKPLYYWEHGHDLSFASELRALARQPGFPCEVDADAVEGYLAFNSIPGPLTAFRAARKLTAGHWLTWHNGRVRSGRWARPAPAAAEAVRRESAPELAAELRDRLRGSVRAHLVSDVPVGVLLSGGIDSSALTAMATEESAIPVQTFSIGFAERSFDELSRARLVAGRFGTQHHELVVRPDASELLPRIVAACDEPLGDSSALPTYLVAQLAAEHVKVVLSGEGGDELFGGYETYVADLLAARIGRVARLLAPVVRALPSSDRRVSVDYRLKRFVRGAGLPPLERHHAWKEIFDRDQRRALAHLDAADPLMRYRGRWAETPDAEPLARLQDVDLGVYLVDDLLVKTDRMSMAHSLETRVPFLDRDVAEFALALPTALKVSGTRKKRLLREAVAPLLPRAIVRARKRGFSIPAAAWLRGPLVPFAREVLAPARTRAQTPGLFVLRQLAILPLARRARTRPRGTVRGLSCQHVARLWGFVGVRGPDGDSVSLWLFSADLAV